MSKPETHPGVDTVLRDFFLGFVRLHVLYHAGREPVYGAELMDELSRHGYRLSPGTLYPLLHRLAAARFLAAERRLVDGRWRMEYRLTEAGAMVLQEARRRLPELVEEVIADSAPLLRPASGVPAAWAAAGDPAASGGPAPAAAASGGAAMSDGAAAAGDPTASGGPAAPARPEPSGGTVRERRRGSGLPHPGEEA